MTSEAEVARWLASVDPEERRRAVGRIADLPPSSRVAPLLSALGDDDWRVRKEAIGLTAELGPEPELLTALADVFEPGDNVAIRGGTYVMDWFEFETMTRELPEQAKGQSGIAG